MNLRTLPPSVSRSFIPGKSFSRASTSSTTVRAELSTSDLPFVSFWRGVGMRTLIAMLSSLSVPRSRAQRIKHCQIDLGYRSAVDRVSFRHRVPPVEEGYDDVDGIGVVRKDRSGPIRMLDV